MRVFSCVQMYDRVNVYIDVNINTYMHVSVKAEIVIEICICNATVFVTRTEIVLGLIL